MMFFVLNTKLKELHRYQHIETEKKKINRGKLNQYCFFDLLSNIKSQKFKYSKVRKHQQF